MYILRQTAHRGVKTVTVVTRFDGIRQTEKECLANEMRKACGAGEAWSRECGSKFKTPSERSWPAS